MFILVPIGVKEPKIDMAKNILIELSGFSTYLSYFTILAKTLQEISKSFEWQIVHKINGNLPVLFTNEIINIQLFRIVQFPYQMMVFCCNIFIFFYLQVSSPATAVAEYIFILSLVIV